MANINGRGKTWEKRELTYLRKNWLLLELRELSNKLGRTMYAIQQQAIKMELPKKPRANTVPDGHVQFIRDNKGKMSVKDMAKYIQCSTPNVYRIAHANGIRFRTPAP